ncbi:uncharacterized protein DNG_10316 [Cephalotrichum gorgonifer]|uniref:Nephrocystin 3-like N-terminal domain-containing protein n=1 Tax=Cephalotrichum gorgonifer TaxID=2041049 RepID=A0AAE8T078_9PEZI|nr:uncharacterized protein DNG_10316 [Cephalotrichum gorgonifer]
MNCRHRHEPVPQSGLTVLFEPDKPSLDVVFVHGFTGHPQRTWTHQKGDPPSSHRCQHATDGASERASKIRKMIPFSSPGGQISRGQNSSSYAPVYWPRDLVPGTLPDARVLTYGYDTRVTHALGPPANKSSVYEMAWDFLVELEAGRRTDPARPLLFVAHSLGGIFVKEALRRSAACQHPRPHRSIFDSTIGIVFFGTPHSGADPRGLPRRLVEKLVTAAGFTVNKQVVNTLLPSAERLRELRDEFNPIVAQQNWTIYSFQEATGVAPLGGEKVVEDTSSYLNLPDLETTQHIGRNHMEMCRFTGFADLEFKKVAAALGKIAKARVMAIASKPDRRPPQAERQALSEVNKRKLLNSLKFDQLDSRWMSIKTAHAETCKWLLQKQEYVDWLDPQKLPEHNGFLWLKGKLGAGKSTIMKYALAHSRKTATHKIVISFFFNARGADLEKSTAGMYRSLLLQLLERLPQLQVVFESLGFADWNTSSRHNWNVESLKDLLGMAVQSLGSVSVACFIDALDECHQAEVRDMVAFFEHLGHVTIPDGIRFQVFFSSRHYPSITISRGLSFVLEGQVGHSQDIADYIDSELRIVQTNLARKIRADLQEKSAGVFMWVVLVVNLLNQEHDEGGDACQLQQKLDETPGDLHELFRDILTRDSHNKDRLLLCIQWLLFAHRPLTPTELYCAIRLGTEPKDGQPDDYSELSLDVMKRFILSSSKGLAEVTQSSIPTVQFIHGSLKDFLLRDNGLGTVWSDLGANFVGQSHDRLKQCCLDYYLGIDIAAHVDIPNPPRRYSKTWDTAKFVLETSEHFPFLKYAVPNVLRHADAAQKNGVCQETFLREFTLAKWINMGNLVRTSGSPHSLKASLLYILGENNLPALIRVYKDVRSAFVVENERYGAPIVAALGLGSHDAVTAMLEVQAQCRGGTFLHHSKWEPNRKHRAYDFYVSDRNVSHYLAKVGDPVLMDFALASGAVNVDLENEDGRKVLNSAIVEGHEAVVKVLLDRGAAVDPTDDIHVEGPLGQAAKAGHEGILELLLDRGATINLADKTTGRTPLFWAAMQGHGAIIELLLNRGAAIDIADTGGLTPLLWAARSGFGVMAELLLDRGAAIDMADKTTGRTPLLWAAMRGHAAIIELLLHRGAAVDISDTWGRTSLSWAAEKGHMVIVNLLLDRGATVDVADRLGQTSLIKAAIVGHTAIVNLLLERGAAINKMDTQGRTPLSCAILFDRQDVANILRDHSATLEG